jgi:hypothetical protein
MIIHQPNILTSNGAVRIDSHIEYASASSAVVNLPRKMWFKFPGNYKWAVMDRSDGFISSLLLLGMYLGEDINVRGRVSPRLAYGLEEYQKLFSLWFPERLQRINIKYEQLKAVPQDKRQIGVGCAYSGGVDSLFTLWSQMPQNESKQNFQITHGLFILGFDLTYKKTDHTYMISQLYRRFFKELGLELIVAQTNVRRFYSYRLDWMYAHGGPLIGTAQIIGNLLKRFYVPSTYYYKNLKPMGTSPLSDHLLETERLQVHHHGAGIQRFDKLDILTTWPEAHSNLRVCTQEKYSGPALNCGACHKCLHTIVYLETKGNVDKYAKVFAQGYSFTGLLRWLLVVFMSNEGIRRLARSALDARRYEIALMMIGVFISVRIRKLIYRFSRSLPYQEKLRLLRVWDSFSGLIRKKPET